MSKRTLWIVAVAITAFALTLNAFAQPGGRGQGGGPGMGPGGGGPGMGPVGMGGEMAQVFQNPEFAKMLEITPEQRTALQGVFQEVGPEIQATMQAEMQKFRDSGTRPTPAEMGAVMDKVIDGIQAKTDKILKPEQQSKIKEVTFQLSGGLESPALAMNTRSLDILELNADQKKKIQETMAKRGEESRELFEKMRQDPNFDFRNPESQEKIRAANEELNKKYAEQVKAVLTPEQKAKAEKLTAEVPALREKLGIPAPGQGRQQQRRGQGDVYAPNEGSWRPGQQQPQGPPPGGERQPPRGAFPRGGGNPPPPQEN